VCTLCWIVGSAGTTAELNAFHVTRSTHRRLQQIAEESVKAASGTQVLAGLASVVLGIMALVNLNGTQNLTLVAFLIVGAAQLLSGSAVASKMAGVQEAST